MGVAFAVGGSQPYFDRNANTGGGIGAETRLVPALQTIFHEGRTFARMTGRGDDGGGVDQEAPPMWTGMDFRIHGKNGGGWVPAFARTKEDARE